MKKIIVTGGSGFIGTNLVNFLIKKNEEVTVFKIFIHMKKYLKTKVEKLFNYTSTLCR